MITLYTQPACSHCTHAKSYLTSLDIPFNEVNIREDAAARDFLVGNGHGSTPQLYVGEHLLVHGGSEGLRAMSRDQIIAQIAALSA